MKKRDALILRYRDPGPKTISEHRRIVDTHGSVWWGWWRKEGIEADGLDLLRKYSAASRFRVGLIDRDLPATSAAECTGVVFDDGGGRIDCPEPELCPEYYRNEQCAAWFRFESIMPSAPGDYHREFGPSPVGNQTMYEVRDDEDGKRIVYPRPEWDLTPVEAPGAQILHLSDIHFGSFHGYPVGRGNSARRPHEEPLHEILLRHLDKAGASVGIVVLSGDSISKGEPAAIAALEHFLERLTDGLDLAPKHFVIVPGNHDFRILDDGEQLPTAEYGHERDFRRFMENFYGKPRLDLERLQRFRTSKGWDITFVALNSARLRAIEVKEYGYVGRHRYEEMLDHVVRVLGRPSMSAKKMLVSVLHHHLVPVPSTELLPPVGPISLTVDAAELLSAFQQNGVQLVLHGHQHLPFVQFGGRALPSAGRLHLPAPGDAVHIVGMGSTGARADALADGLRDNTFGLYEPFTDGLSTQIFSFTRAKRPDIYLVGTLPLRGSASPSAGSAISTEVGD